MQDFDAAAQNYDEQFTHSIVGKEQRKQVWKYLRKLKITPVSNVLEVNCGTGEDASIWAKDGHKVIATDISSGMVRKAREKYPDITFEVMDVENIASKEGDFDIIFSNFGGLNCIAPKALSDFIEKAAQKLTSNGKLIMVIMGKKCWWDRWYMKRKNKDHNRRNSSGPVQVMVDGQSVSTWYYSPKQMKAFAKSHFDLQKIKPIGLFVPPSYLAPYFERKKSLFGLLRFLDKCFSFPSLSNQADHYFICLTKKDS